MLGLGQGGTKQRRTGSASHFSAQQQDHDALDLGNWESHVTTSRSPPPRSASALLLCRSRPINYCLWLAVLALALFLLSGHGTRSISLDVSLAGHAEQQHLKQMDVGPKRLPAKSSHKDRYLAYNSHSGYHNQRIALENALTLAKLLDRTLLLPPVRLGTAVPWVAYDKMRLRLEQSNKVGLEHCSNFSLQGILPRECIGYFDWTTVNWDLFVDMQHVQTDLHQPLIDRWDESEAWLVNKLHINPAQDVHALKENDLYQYRFYDSLADTEPLDKFRQRVDISDLRNIDAKLLHVGSLFGTSRLRTVEEEAWEIRSGFRQATVFRNPTLDHLTDNIRDLLGGHAAYFAVHMRLGDGVFRTQAKQNVAAVFRQLLSQKIKLSTDAVNQAFDLFAPGFPTALGNEKPAGGDLQKRGLDVDYEAELPSLAKRASNSRPQRPGAYKHAWPKPPPLVTSARKSPLDASLTCRGKLHPADSPFVQLNYPLFIATDSRNPVHDPLLAPFFAAFPCTFVLGDFTRGSPELEEMTSWRNQEDQVDLSQFLWPVIDMMIASKGRNIVGTPASTFSRFATDVLFQSYHGWDIIERG